MLQIIPTILTLDPEEAKEKLQKLQGKVSWVHLDIMDGKFVNNRTVQLKDFLKIKLLSKFKIQAHLMVKEPIRLIRDAERIKVARVVGQIEMMADQEKFVNEVLEKGMKPGLALDLETKIKGIEKMVLPKLDSVLIMTVKAGWGAQKLDKKRLDEVRKLRKMREKKGFKFKIAVDGGVNKETIKDCVKAGAEILAAGSVFWKSADPSLTMADLKSRASRAYDKSNK